MHAVALALEWLVGLAVLFNAGLYAARTLALRREIEPLRVEPIGLVNAVWAFLRECAASVAVALLTPLGLLMSHCRRAAGTRGPVVLVHGWSLSRGSWWLLRRRLLRDGWSPVCCFDYGSITADVESAAIQLGTFVQRLVEANAAPPALIGHGLGGLVIRNYAGRCAHAEVQRIITLGTPHQGTDLAARLFPHLKPGSAFLRDLKASDRAVRRYDVIAIHSTFDAVVLPPSNARYPIALNVQLNDVGHNTLLFSRRVYGLLAENLAAPLPSQAGGS